MPEIIFNGPVGRLEGRYQLVKTPKAPTALILSTHPQYGGTMNNEITYHLYYKFFQMGFNVLRFNFRGVGNSEGRFDNGQGELADAACALDWLQSNFPESRSCWVAGASFGSWIAMHLLMRRPEIRRFVCASLPASNYDFSFLAPCPCSGLIANGELDNVSPEAETEHLVNRLSLQKNVNIEYLSVAGANHFFYKKIDDLMNYVCEYIKVEKNKNDFEQPRKRRKVLLAS